MLQRRADRLPLTLSQSRAVWSQLPVTTLLPLGLNAAATSEP
jgi:hypothetical protein